MSTDHVSQKLLPAKMRTLVPRLDIVRAILDFHQSSTRVALIPLSLTFLRDSYNGSRLRHTMPSIQVCD